MADAGDERAREIQDAIREVLFREWDPISVNSNENLRDEYDSYVGRIYRVIASDPNRHAVARELLTIERECMGLGQGREETLFPVADRLLSIDVRLTP